MKITIQSGILAKNLSIVSSVVKEKPFVPITSNFLFEAESVLTITGTDNVHDIQSTIEDVQVHIAGSCIIPAKDFFNIIKSLPNQPVVITHTSKRVNLKTSNGSYDFATEDNFDEFPLRRSEKLDNQLEINIDLLAKAINHNFNTMPSEDAHSSRNGLFIHSDSEMKLRFACVSTNAGVVAVFKTNIHCDKIVKIVIGKTSVSLLKNIISNKSQPVLVKFNANSITFVCENTTLSCSVLGENFVEYEAIIPTSIIAQIQTGRDSFNNSIKRVTLLTENEHAAIGLNLSEDINVRYCDPLSGKDASESVNYDLCTNKDFSINVKAREFANMLSTLESKTVDIKFSGSNTAFVVENLEPQIDYSAHFYAAPVRQN